MFFVPDLATLVIEAVDLKTILKDFNLEVTPGETDGLPIAFGHTGRKLESSSASRQKIMRIGDGTTVKWVGTSCDQLIDVGSNLVPIR